METLTTVLTPHLIAAGGVCYVGMTRSTTAKIGEGYEKIEGLVLLPVLVSDDPLAGAAQAYQAVRDLLIAQMAGDEAALAATAQAAQHAPSGKQLGWLKSLAGRLDAAYLDAACASLGVDPVAVRALLAPTMPGVTGSVISDLIDALKTPERLDAAVAARRAGTDAPARAPAPAAAPATSAAPATRRGGKLTKAEQAAQVARVAVLEADTAGSDIPF